MVIGQSVSVIGTQVTQVTVPIQVYKLTGSSLAVGLVGIAALLPLVLLGLYGGAIADAVNRRSLLLVTSVGSGLVSVVLLTQAALGLDELWLLYTCVAVQGGLFAIDSPTRRAVLPQVVAPEQIAAANTIFMGLFSIGVVLGPLLGGVVVAASGFTAAYAIDLATFVVVFGAVVLGLPSLPPAVGSPRAGLSSIVEGLRFLRGRRNLLMTFVHDINAMVFGMSRAAFPAFAATQFHAGPRVVGYLYAAPGIGVMLVSVVGGLVSRVRRQGLGVVIAIGFWGAAIVLVGLSHSLAVAVIALAIAGGADAVSAIYRSTILQVAAPAEMQGRLSGVFMVVVAGGPRLGDLEAGAVASLASPQVAIVSGGLACLAILGLLCLAVPSFLRYDAEHPTP
jgi:MFS family permease